MAEKYSTWKEWEEDRDTVEGILDKRDMKGMIEMLADISYLKAEHLRSDWQDEVSAKTWEKIASRLEKLKEVV
jgi:hypothetical protein